MEIYGTTGNDSLIGTNARNDIEGRAGDDTLHGLGGNDDLYGGAGKRHPRWRRGRRRLNGGLGRTCSTSGGLRPDRGSDGRGQDRDSTRPWHFEFCGADGAGCPAEAGETRCSNFGGGNMLLLEDVRPGQISAEQFASRAVESSLPPQHGPGVATPGDDTLTGTTTVGDARCLSGNDQIRDWRRETTIWTAVRNETLVGGSGRDDLTADKATTACWMMAERRP